MRGDKDQAIELRKQGKSYAEIKEELGVPKSTLSDWLSPHDWSESIKEVLREQAQKRSTARIKAMNRRQAESLEKIYQEAEEEARGEFEKLKYHPLFVASIAAYLGEGDRRGKYRVGVSNSQPALPRLFTTFLREICNVPESDIWVDLFVYEDLDIEECKEYWRDILDIDIENFHQPVTLPSRSDMRRINNGVCRVGTTSAYLKRKINVWLEKLPEEMFTKDYYQDMRA